MRINDILRAMAGFLVLLSLVLARYFNPKFLLLAGFVGLNLLQSGFTKKCPAIWILRKMGFKDC